MKISGIYKIENIINGKVYIGSSVNVKRRTDKHKYMLNNNKHYNRYLQRSYNKYGIGAFKFSIIEKCEVNELIEREQYWVDSYKNSGILYNLRIECVTTSLGTKLSKKTIMKIRSKNLGRIISEETRRKISEGNKGKKLSEETKNKIKKSRLGKKVKIKTRKKISKTLKEKKLKGKTCSEETRRKISESHKGKPNLALRGYKHTEETKRKISEAKKGIIPSKATPETIKKRNETRRKNNLHKKNEKEITLQKIRKLLQGI